MKINLLILSMLFSFYQLAQSCEMEVDNGSGSQIYARLPQEIIKSIKSKNSSDCIKKINKFLVDGGKIDTRDPYTKDDNTMLELAIEPGGNIEVLKYLIFKKADKDLFNHNNQIPLILLLRTADMQALEIVAEKFQILMNAKPNLHYRDKFKKAPYDYAIERMEYWKKCYESISKSDYANKEVIETVFERYLLYNSIAEYIGS